MKTKSTLRSFLFLAGSSLLAISSASAQATLTWDTAPGTVGPGDSAITGGAGAWNTTNGNWTVDAGVNNIAWDNTDPSVNTAVFNAAGNNGTRTVTLEETINLKALTFSNLRNSGPVQKYTITGSTLAFSSGGSITTGTSLDNVLNAEYASINSAITGAPNVSLSWASGGNNQLVFAPASGSQALGTVTGTGFIKLAGSTTGNTLVGLNASSAGKVRMSSGTWTLTGTATGYEHFIEGGILIITGSLQNNNRDTVLGSGGTLHWNSAAAIKDNSINTLRDRDFRIDGGSIDNTSGAAITSNQNPQMRWNGNWTFMGSNGANSNLNMGTGQVFLTGNRQVTVTNSAATLTVGGVIANLDTTARSLTKAGAGTLELRGVNTYTGATTVSAGTLKMGANNIISDASNVTIGTATLDADTRTDTAGTLDVTGTAVINLGSGAALAFANSSGVTAGVWAGTLNITGTFVPGNDVDPGLGVNPGSIRFGTDNTGLTASQLAAISVNGSGAGTYTLDAFGYLKPSGGGDVTPPTLTSIADNVSGGPVVVNTLVTYTVTFNEDMNDATVSFADFSNAGTSTISFGTITETSPGVFSVPVTPTTAGTLVLQIPVGASLADAAGNLLDNDPALVDDTITVQTQYAAWAGGALFGDDANGDGVSNGLAFLLGAANANDSALALLPTVDESSGDLVLTFDMLDSASRGTATLSVEHSNDLGIGDPWTTVAVPDASGGPTSGVTFVVSGSGTLDVTATVGSAQAGGTGKLFGRLKAVQTP